MLFSFIEFNREEQTLRDALAAISARAYEKQLAQRRWSLAELGLASDDYHWLKEWAARLNRDFLRHVLRDQKNDAAFGLLFLLFCTEVARRDVLPGTVWEPIRAALPCEARNYLFPYIAPRVIQAAARRYQLRHVFDMEGGKNWMITIHLQFGLHYASLPPEPDLPDTPDLSNWLRQINVPDGMGHLLGYGTQPLLASDTFQRLFVDLRLYRRERISRTELLRRIETSPWVLPEYHDRLLKGARFFDRSGNPSDEDETQSEGERRAAPPFIGNARLAFNQNGKPEFRAALINTTAQPWEGNWLEIVSENRRLAELVKRNDGSWYNLEATGQADEIALPLEKSHCVLCCQNAAGTLRDYHTVCFWDTNELVSIYDADGSRLTEPPAAQNRPFWIIVGSDLTLTPEPERWYNCGDGFRLCEVTRRADEPIRLLHDDTVLWQPQNRVNRAAAADYLPAVWHAEGERALRIDPARNLSPKVFLPAGARLLWARGLGVPLEIGERAPLWQVGPLPCAAGALPPTVLLFLGYELNGKTVTARARLETSGLDLQGILALHSGAWINTDALKGCYSVEEAASMPLRVFPAPKESSYWFEEGAWLGTFHEKRRKPPHGWGGALHFQERLYNLNKSDCLPIMACVTNPAEIKAGHWDDNTLRLTFRSPWPIDPERHRLTVWLPDHTLCTVTAQKETAWAAPPIAAALSYDGKRIGAWWADGWERHLPTLTVEQVGRIAAFLRWAQLPLLCADPAREIKTLLQKMPGRMLRAWLQDDFLPFPLQWDESEEGWRDVLETLLHDWDLAPHAARLRVQIGGDERDPWIVADRLRWVSPLIAARYLRWVFPDRRAAQNCYDEWGLVPEEELFKQIDALRERAGVNRYMIVNPHVGLRKLAQTARDDQNALDFLRQKNLSFAAAYLPAFRDLLCRDLLEGRL